jgi:uncharacterized membrane protein
MVAWGARVFGLGIFALGLVCLAFGDFDFGQSVPKEFPARLPLAYAAAVFMMLAGAAIQWSHTLQKGAAALAIYFGMVVVIVMDGRIIVAHYAEYGTYSSIAAQVAVAAAALILWAGTLHDPTRAARLVRAGQITFGICALLFGGAHFVFMNLTAPLVPTWLPPSPQFWGYATGIFHIAGGLAVLTRFQARLAGILLTVMYAAFTPMVHLPLAMAHPENHFVWSENAMNVVLVGVAWVVAGSFAPGAMGRMKR